MSAGIQVAYLAAAVLFILGLRNLSNPRTAVRGNGIAAGGMLVAVVATLLANRVIDYATIAAGFVVGAGIGALLATRIQMTAMPQMVALLNGFGGAASALVAGGELLSAAVRGGGLAGGIVPVAVVLSILIGGVTLTGSLVAFLPGLSSTTIGCCPKRCPTLLSGASWPET